MGQVNDAFTRRRLGGATEWYLGAQSYHGEHSATGGRQAHGGDQGTVCERG